MKKEKADLVIIGSGPAGYVCAIRAAQLGRKVTVIEKGAIGGVCLNVGCIPSKAMIYAGSLVEKASHAEDMGITFGPAKIDMKKLVEWKGTVVKKLTGGVATLLKANGCKVIAGEAKFLGPRSLHVKSAEGEMELEFEDVVIATGSRPANIPSLPVDNETILDSTGALEQQKQPKSLLCIGGGYIGLELGTFYAKIGTKVTVVEAASGLLRGVDPDLTKVVEKGLKKRGVTVHLNTKVKSTKKGKGGVEVEFEGPDGKTFTESFEKVLVTIGRKPNTDTIAIEKTGVRMDQYGFILVNDRRQTTIPHIYAIGDAAGQPLLAHKGSKEGIVAAEVLGGMNVGYDVKAMPAVIFTDPEVATVGLSEAEARAQEYDVMVGQFPFVANGRALSVNEPEGFVKMVGDKRTGRLLGVHIVGAEASNLIAECALAIEMGATVEDVALTVHPHPTLPETLMEAAEATLGHAIHIFQKKPSAGAAAKSVAAPANV